MALHDFASSCWQSCGRNRVQRRADERSPDRTQARTPAQERVEAYLVCRPLPCCAARAEAGGDQGPRSLASARIATTRMPCASRELERLLMHAGKADLAVPRVLARPCGRVAEAMGEGEAVSNSRTCLKTPQLVTGVRVGVWMRVRLSLLWRARARAVPASTISSHSNAACMHALKRRVIASNLHHLPEAARLFFDQRCARPRHISGVCVSRCVAGCDSGVVSDFPAPCAVFVRAVGGRRLTAPRARQTRQSRRGAVP